MLKLLPTITLALGLFASLSPLGAQEIAPKCVAFHGSIDRYSRGVSLESGEALLSYVSGHEKSVILMPDAEGCTEVVFPSSHPGIRTYLTAIDGTHILGKHGPRIWLSSDSGNSWARIEGEPGLITKSDPLAVANLFRLGALKFDSHSKQISWLGPDQLLNYSFLAVSIDAHDVALASVNFNGRFGTDTYGLLESRDAGKSWEWLVKEGGFTFDESGNYFAQHLFSKGSDIWISSDVSDDMFSTSDASQSWSRVEAPDRIISAIYFRNAREGRIIGGSTGSIFETHDAGKNWSKLTDDEVTNPSFTNFFSGDEFFRWNDFRVYQLALGSIKK